MSEQSIYFRHLILFYFHHYYDIVPISPSRMSGLAVKQVFLRNFCKNISISERLTSSCYNLMGIMANSAAQQKLNQASMEPFLEMYYNSSNNHEIPLTFSSENLACENNLQTVALETSTCVDTSMLLKERYLTDKQKYKAIRQWKRLKKEKLTSNSEEFFILRVLSFNILAQYLLETYPFLYKGHDKRALPWKIRRQLLLQEILGAQANVICLQEMQEEHLQEFLIPFKDLGYNYIYKKRTNDKRDGLLFLYRSDQLTLMEYAKVELYQSGIELLSRDNVGIIAKLALKESPETQLVIATTHLLYNPRRNDVRLGQVQLLLAEIERIAFLENTMMGAKYLPIILVGDFNLTPDSGVYEFITEGVFEYQGKSKSLEETEYRSLSNSLIPPRLCITDSCQHFNVLKHRLRGEGTDRVMLENSEHFMAEENVSSYHCEVNADTTDLQTIEIAHGYHVKFCSGTLTHPFRFNSVYKHRNRHGELEATTNQDEWVTVDYIFYSDLELVENYKLPLVKQCSTLPTIPNFAVGSDHFCLGATFKVHKRKPQIC
ncbi:Protein angel like protein 2 [Habropoda laboriosa]|uniref:Protein angel like protein 2 n=1 Tax=Habropoda laboriosa TaxID=597456 RepID=A0A0L7QK42_9HYME|nr:Protein angel like protein 2 [Habropoda laboriosa]